MNGPAVLPGEALPAPAGRWLNRTVLGAGLTSALGDFCYETTTVIMPGFLEVLGVPAAALGAIEGAADALASFTKMFAGYFADRLGHRKLLVVAGYALTPLGQIFIASASGWPLLALGRLTSWFGKGIRAPLRDAIVIQAIAPGMRGRAFGFHRAMDSLGAVFGPLLGVLLLGWAKTLDWASPDRPFRLVLYLAIVPGALSVLAFLTLVRDPQHSPNPALRFFKTLRSFNGRFRRYLKSIFIFGAGDFSHSMLVLAAAELLAPAWGRVVAAQWAGLLYVGRNVVEVAMSYPIGVLADRVGSRKVLVGGYVLGASTALLTAITFMLPQEARMASLAGVFLLAGLYVSVQESLESTVAADLVPKPILAAGYGALGAVNGVAKFVSSTLVGVLWSAVSPVAAFTVAALLMGIGTLSLSRMPPGASIDDPATGDVSDTNPSG